MSECEGVLTAEQRKQLAQLRHSSGETEPTAADAEPSKDEPKLTTVAPTKKKSASTKNK